MATNSRPYGSVGMASLLWRWQAAGGGSVPAGPRERLFFFFLGYGRCGTVARSLHEHKLSKLHLYKDTEGP